MGIEEAVFSTRFPRYTVKGFTGTLIELSKHFGVNYATLQYRLKIGWDIEKAVLMPVYEGGAPEQHTVQGFTGTYYEIAEHFGIKYNTLVQRLRNGRTLDEAVSTKRLNRRSKN